MADSALDIVAKLIQSPPGQLAAGGVLAGIVWKFFERVEAVLTDQTKLEIAVWLLGVKVSQKVEPWPETFAKVFDRVFGTKHLSWRCFGRSCLATLIASVICAVGLFAYLRPFDSFPYSGPGPQSEGEVAALVLRLAVMSSIFLCLFDYASLLETRFTLHLLHRWSSWYAVLILLLADVVVTGVTGVIPSYFGNLGSTLHPFQTYSQKVAADASFSVTYKSNLERSE